MSGTGNALLALASGAVAGAGVIVGVVYVYAWLAKMRPELARHLPPAEQLSPPEPGDEVAVTLTIPKITPEMLAAGKPPTHRRAKPRRRPKPGYRECGG